MFLSLLKHGCQVMFQTKMSKSQTLSNCFVTTETTVLVVVSEFMSEILCMPFHGMLVILLVSKQFVLKYVFASENYLLVGLTSS